MAYHRLVVVLHGNRQFLTIYRQKICPDMQISLLTNVVLLDIHLVDVFLGNLSKTGFGSKKGRHNVLLSHMQYKIIKKTNPCNVRKNPIIIIIIINYLSLSNQD